MPKSTFLNLPEEKRKRITELALDEFSTHPYRQASLSRIVSRAGIAKGSMYQYFENKLDLYKWLVTDELERRRQEWLESHSQPSGGDVFAELERLAMTHVGFMLAHPRLARLADSARSATSDKALRDLHRELRERQLSRLAALIERGQESGDLRSDVSPRVLAHLVETMLLQGTSGAVLDHLGIDPSAKTIELAAVQSPAWRELVSQSIGLLEQGLVNGGPKARGTDERGGATPERDASLGGLRGALDWRQIEESPRDPKVELPA